MKYVALIAMLLLSMFSYALAEPMSESDIPVRYPSWHITYDVNGDGSYVETQKWSTIILKESALKNNKQASVTFSTSVAKGEVLEAYTLKKTGKRIDAPKSSYQVSTNDGYNSGSPLYSDETTISVVYPDLAVGDTTVFSYRITNREGMFPNQFSISHYFSRFTAYDDVTIQCGGGHSIEEYRYEFPSTLTIVGYPKDYEFSGSVVDYKATYRMSGTTLTVKRELRDKTMSNVCSPGFTEDFRKVEREILRDTRAQVLITL